MKILFSTLLFICLCFNSKGQAVIYVDSANTGAANGSSWATAFPELQDALEAAQPGSQIWVAKGTYTPSKDKDDLVPSFGSDKIFMMRKGVRIYGGFNGTETNLNQRNWRVNKCVLNGDQPNTAYDSRTVVRADSIDSTAALDGFYITGGTQGTYLYEIGYHTGGGICLTYSNPNLSKLFIHHNEAEAGGGIGMYKSNPMMVNLKVLENRMGGGIYLFRSNADVVNSLIARNHSDYLGPGALHAQFSSPNLTNVTIVSGTVSGADYPHALKNLGNPDYGNPIIKNSIIDGRTLSAAPSAVFYYNSVIGGHRWSLPWDTAVGVDGGGNLDTWMIYTDSANNNFRVEYCSPNIDAGSLQYLPLDHLDLDQDGDTTEVIPIDIEGKPRAINGFVDIGAYEGASPILADTVQVELCLGESITIGDTTITSHGFHLLGFPVRDVCDTLNYYDVRSPVDTRVIIDTAGRTLSANVQGAEYQWYDCANKVKLTNITSRTFSPWFPGTYSVIITQNGCTDTSECITVNQVGLKELNAAFSAMIYPNPSEGIYNIEFPEVLHDAEITVTNLTGKVILQKEIKDGSEASIDLTSRPAGIYLLKIADRKHMATYRLVKQ